MKIVLTDASTKQEVVVDSEKISLFEPSFGADGQPDGGTHLVFNADLGRKVQESPASIGAIIGVISVPMSKQAFAADVAKGPKKK